MVIWYKKIMGDLCYVIEVNDCLVDITEKQAEEFKNAGIEVREGDF